MLSEFIYLHFTGKKKDKKGNIIVKGTYSPLNAQSLKKKALQEFTDTDWDSLYSVKDVFLPFTEHKLEKNLSSNGAYSSKLIFLRLNTVKDALWEFMTKGMYAETLANDNNEMMQVFAKAEMRGGSFYSIFQIDDDYWKTENGFDSSNKIDKYFNLIKTLGEAEVTGEKYKFVDDIVFKLGDKATLKNDEEIILASTLISLIKTAKEKNVPQHLFKPAVYLSSILVLASITGKDYPETTNELIKKMVPFLHASISAENQNVDNFTLKNIAVDLANSRIRQLNDRISSPDDKYKELDDLFKSLQIRKLFEEKIVKFSDIPLQWSGQGVNPKWKFIDRDGSEFQIFVEPKEALGDETNLTDIFFSLESNDEDKILAGFEFIDKELLKVGRIVKRNRVGKEDFKTAVEILYTNLILLSYLVKEEKIKDTEILSMLEEIFVLPLVQCQMSLSKKQLEVCEASAYENVRYIFEVAHKGKEFSEKFGFFTNRYEKEKLSKEFLKAVAGTIKTLKQKNQLKKRDYNVVAAAALKDSLDVVSDGLRFKHGIIANLYRSIAPADYEKGKASDSMKSDYGAIYDTKPEDISVADGVPDRQKVLLYLKTLAYIGQGLSAIASLAKEMPIDGEKIAEAKEDKKIRPEDIESTIGGFVEEVREIF